MAEIAHWTIPGSNDQPIFGSTHLPAAGTTPRGVMILCHGFRGYKDYGFFPRLAALAGQNGLIAHRFNFSHSGVTEDFETFARPDLFEHDSWGKQIADLHTVATASKSTLPGADLSAKLPVVWFGHSRGGVTVLLAAARCQPSGGEPAPPTAVIAAASPHRSCWISDEQRQELVERGYLATPSSRTGQMLRIDKAWLDEIEADPDAFDPLVAARSIDCPVLLIHGDDDQAVPLEASRQLAASAGSRATLTVMPGASHTFNAPNPLAIDQHGPTLTEQFLSSVIAFALDRGQARG